MDTIFTSYHSSVNTFLFLELDRNETTKGLEHWKSFEFTISCLFDTPPYCPIFSLKKKKKISNQSTRSIVGAHIDRSGTCSSPGTRSGIPGLNLTPIQVLFVNRSKFKTCSFEESEI